MIQDIYPSKLDNSFADRAPGPNDPLLLFDEQGRMLAQITEGQITFPTAAQVAYTDAVYLFSVDAASYFLALGKADCTDETFRHYTIRELRDLGGGKELLAAFTAYHLWKWYDDNRFCGKCQTKLAVHNAERVLRCECCGNMIYPRINPAVIVGVIKGDSLLITRYNRGYAHNALVAGFTEIGETLEETVAREVMEETGVSVKNIRYYKSQPWVIAQDILVGFFCDADGDAVIHRDTNELKYAEWVEREKIELQPNNLSLTNEMMQVFKEGTIR
ncbi:MAG: NAD(+) diphosphatase [Oscillospiraceae bacterium]|nr:NAD(+) diphosphatase [Oscillospiraceae bacterium]